MGYDTQVSSVIKRKSRIKSIYTFLRVAIKYTYPQTNDMLLSIYFIITIVSF